MTNSIFTRLRSRLRQGSENPSAPGSQEASASKDYWTDHNVTLHHAFKSREESLGYFHWRNDQYYNYIELMPVAGFEGKRILDFGCGPGNDLVGFGTYSQGADLVGVDVSRTSIAEASARLQLHGIEARTLVVDNSVNLPFESASFDHIHSSGVLHHAPDALSVLSELRRILKSDGSMNVMVYNYDSIWLHLHVAYIRSILEGRYPGESIRDQFRHSTDGEDCPVSNVYRPEEWIELCAAAGLHAEYKGAAVSAYELSILEKRFAAIMDRRLPEESRTFLKSLTFDSRGIPFYQGRCGGIDGCYSLRVSS